MGLARSIQRDGIDSESEPSLDQSAPAQRALGICPTASRDGIFGPSTEIISNPMQIKLAYGRDGLTVNLPDRTQVLRARFVPGVGDEAAAIRAALRQPIQCA